MAARHAELLFMHTAESRNRFTNICVPDRTILRKLPSRSWEAKKVIRERGKDREQEINNSLSERCTGNLPEQC